MAASSNSSSSPSSSAVTIPIPGKSILKRPPATPQSLFSRITRFLPTTPHASQSDEAKPLKRAHFILPQIATVYPISSINPPSTPSLKDEKKAIEDREAERRRRVVRGNSISTDPNDSEEWWNMGKVESFYRECCAGCDEQPDPGITAALKHAAPTNPRTVDLSGVQLTLTSASVLSDVFTIEWGLRKLVLRECDLDEHILKPILHALLIPGSLSFLSVASNRRLKPPAFRLIGAYTAKANTLQFLDLSQNALDKKSVEYIVASLTTAPAPGLLSLRLDDCSLGPAALQVLARAVRTSSLRNISLRHNRINATGAVALALMIRDYPDVVPASPSTGNSLTPASSVTSSPTSSVSSLPPVTHLEVPTSPQLPVSPTVRAGPVLPPPRHPSTTPQTTYTPYIPRSRRGGRPAAPTPNPLSPTGQPVPIITSSSQGGITTRHPVPVSPNPSAANGDANVRHNAGPSAALLDKVRALDALPRLGALRTLDLRGNDLRGGINYIAQVLKRNRTLKVLNLSENKLDVQCLVSVAEALKYNSSLETLDLSKNPCSGPALEGIQSLRTAFTLNTALKRLFLSSTSMTSAGAIALAEFLPESTSLLHLDLTMNNLDIAGVMALSSGLKANHTMRCLDLNIPPGDEEFARMCRDILNSCVRNTEEAERLSHNPNGVGGESGRGLGKGVWGMIEESELAKTIRQDEEKKIGSDILLRARECVKRLTNAESGSSSPSPSLLSPPSTPTPASASKDPASLAEKAKSVAVELANEIQTTGDIVRLEDLLNVNDELTALLARMPGFGRPILKLQGLGLQWQRGGSPSPVSSGTASTWSGPPNGNGAVHDDTIPGELTQEDQDDDEEPEPVTPRIDKGKGRAEPEPEEPEKVLSPSFMITEDEDEDDDGSHFPPEESSDIEDPESVAGPSPVDRSKIWVEEEGEVFRKGTVLLGPEEMEGDFAGEELRIELLEAMVERRSRSTLNEFNVDGNIMEDEAPSPVSPVSPAVPSPTEANKIPPRPYISRSRSTSSSILSVISPTLGSPTLQPGSSTTSPTSATSSPRSPSILPASPLSSTQSPRPYLARSRSASNVETQ